MITAVQDTKLEDYFGEGDVAQPIGKVEVTLSEADIAFDLEKEDLIKEYYDKIIALQGEIEVTANAKKDAETRIKKMIAQKVGYYNSMGELNDKKVKSGPLGKAIQSIAEERNVMLEDMELMETYQGVLEDKNFPKERLMAFETSKNELSDLKSDYRNLVKHGGGSLDDSTIKAIVTLAESRKGTETNTESIKTHAHLIEKVKQILEK